MVVGALELRSHIAKSRGQRRGLGHRQRQTVILAQRDIRLRIARHHG